MLSCLIWGTALLCSAAGAYAAEEERGRVFGGSFGEGALSLLPAGPGAPGSGVAVSQATHDVYVTDTVNHRVEQFSAGGAFIRAWGWGVTNGASELQVCTSACLVGLPGTAPGQFEAPTSIAVDNSAGGGGDVYVAEFAGFRSPDSHIQKFTPEGALVKSWGVEGQLTEGPLTNGEAFFAIGGIGVDATGDLWVGTAGGIFEFAQAGAFTQRFASTGNSVGLAVDALGNVSVLNAGSVDVQKFSTGGTNQGVELQLPTQPSGIAVASEPDEVFTDQGDAVARGPPSCAASLTEPFCKPAEFFGSPQLTGGAGLALDSETGTVFVADTGSQRIDSFILEAPAVPAVKSESLSAVSADSATFGAQVNPRSLSGEAPTRYEFEYGPCNSSSSCASSGYESSAPVPPGTLSPDFEAHTLSTHVSGLQPQRTYHFRLLARNAHGPAEGEERTFTTQSPGGALILPDGRAWELVSPPNKQGAKIEPIAEVGVVQAATDGDAITYLANAATEAEPQGAANESQVLSSRGPNGWSSRDIAIPHISATGSPNGPGPEYKFFSEDLSSGIVQPFGEFNPGLSDEASESTPFLHSLASPCEEPCYRPLVSGKPGFENVTPGVKFGEEAKCKPHLGASAEIFCGPEFLGATEDLSHVVLRSEAELKSGAGTGQLYEWGGGSLSPVSVLPGGEPAPAGRAQLGESDIAAQRAISSDGARVIWRSEEKLYLRDTSTKETAQLDEAEPGCLSCESGAGAFQVASADGSRVLFTDARRLTADSGAGIEKADLYECELVQRAGKLACSLSDLTPERGGEGASVQGGVLGASEDGSWVYFVAEGVLSATANARAQSAVAGEANLYVRHGASTSFIATLASGDSHDWEAPLSGQPTRVAPDGEWAAFMSEAPLTDYDNRDVRTGKPVAEVYLYDAASNSLSCASCEPSGARPSGVEYKKLEAGQGSLVGGTELWTPTALVAANVPGWTAIASGAQLKSRHQPDYLSNSGRLFFNSADGLVSQDANGTEDVYEYEPPGVGDCTTASENFSEGSGGCVNLISSGSSAQESAFLDASEDGADVFFLTSAKLTSVDVDTAVDVYDAHECTGASPCIEPSSVQSPPCSTEASCKASPTPQPSIFGAPSSSTFSGAGNPPAAPTPPPKPKTAAQIRAEKLAKALKACKKEKKKQNRLACQKQAQRKYGVKAKAKAKKSAHKPKRKKS